MKNRIELKRCLLRICFGVFLFCIVAFVYHCYEIQQTQDIYNQALIRILSVVRESYPDLSEKDIMRILNRTADRTDDEMAEAIANTESFLSKHGIKPERDSALLEYEQNSVLYTVGWIGIVLGVGAFACLLFLSYNKKKDRDILQITRYLEEINRKNYALEMETMSEEELSMLKTEIYKTTVMLKEAAENSKKDKENLKDALADISHQMKTPLTSVLVVLDNIIDDPEMEPELRQDFVRDVKREIGHLQFLVQALLKMTKLDAGTITFLKEKVSLRDVAEGAICNVSPLCDLKNVEIVTEFVDETEKKEWFCDYRWQVEAVTNLLKNGVEHSPAGSRVLIKTESNQVYHSISIIDFGPGIDKEDIRHLFERFYRGKNASADGVGIGLPLAKAIIEQENGRVFVESSEEKTVFEVKYFL